MTDRRWTQFVVTRLALAVLVAIGFALLGRAVLVPAVAVVGYGCGVLAIESTRRRRREPGDGLVTPLVLIDGVLIALAVTATGGISSPLEIVVGLQIVAVALAVSGRVGLEAAIWQAGLLLVATPPAAGDAPVASPFWHAGAYLGVGLIVATVAATDRRSDRRREAQLQEQIRYLATLEPVTRTEEACHALALHMTRAGFRRCAVVITGASRSVGALADEQVGDAVLVDASLPRTPGVLLARDASVDPHLVRGLDPQDDPLLDRLLPFADNLVGVPIVVDGHHLGVAVAEWKAGVRARIPQGAIDRFRRDAAHCGLALRSVLLLEEVEQRSRRDLLTGLVNRRGFDEAIDAELSRIERSPCAMSLALVDLDRFKAVNDTFGHQVGDRLLADVGDALRSALRSHDVAARIGGDEFAVLLPDCTGEMALVVAERVRVAIGAAVGDRDVSASIGVATAPRQGRTRAALVRAADDALYAAKAAGRDCTMVSERGPVTEPVLVLEDVEGRVRPHRRADLRSRVSHPAGRGRTLAES